MKPIFSIALLFLLAACISAQTVPSSSMPQTKYNNIFKMGYWDTVGFTINLSFDMVGAVIFISFLTIIIKYKKLRRSSCHKLIAIFAICCLGSKVIIVFPYMIRVIPLPNVPTWVCSCTQIVPMSLTMSITPVTMIIGVDRMISVLFPIWYMHRGKNGYLALLCLIASFYPIYLGVFLVKNTIENTFNQTNCTTEELYGHVKAEWNSIYNLIIFVCYVVMFLRFFCFGREGRKAYIRQQPIFKSLVTILIIQFVGYFIVNGGYSMAGVVTNNWTWPADQINMYFYAWNCMSSTITTVEVPAIYFTSSEYRKAFQEEFGWFLFPFGQHQTSPTTVIASTNASNIVNVQNKNHHSMPASSVVLPRTQNFVSSDHRTQP